MISFIIQLVCVIQFSFKASISFYIRNPVLFSRSIVYRVLSGKEILTLSKLEFTAASILDYKLYERYCLEHLSDSFRYKVLILVARGICFFLHPYNYRLHLLHLLVLFSKHFFFLGNVSRKTRIRKTFDKCYSHLHPILYLIMSDSDRLSIMSSLRDLSCISDNLTRAFLYDVLKISCSVFSLLSKSRI